MEKRYYYLNSARTAPLGPHSLAELSNMLLHGQLSPTTEVAAEGDKRWVALPPLLAASGQLLPPVPAPAPDATALPLPPVPAPAPGVATLPLPPVPKDAADEDLPPVPGYMPLPPIPAAPVPVLPTKADGPAGNCPTCARELVTEDGQLPPNCPHCGAYLRPSRNALWQHIRAALKRPLTWHGRSPRAEYWGSFLFYLFTATPLTLAAVVIIIISATREFKGIPVAELSFEQVAYAPGMVWAWVAAGVLALYMLYFTLVSIAAGIRRLHDIGRSGWWLGTVLIMNLAWQFTYVRKVIDYIGGINWQLIAAIDDDASRKSRLNEIADSINLLAYDGLCGLFYLLSMCFGLTLFVFSLMDSKPGPNKYGPSAKYPLS